MAKFTKGFPSALMTNSINCFGGVYSKGFFNYTWHYATPNYVFEFNDIEEYGKDEKTYVCKIYRRNPWYKRNELIWDGEYWLNGSTVEDEILVQSQYEAMIKDFKDRQKYLEKMGMVEHLKYKDANEFINNN